MSFDLYVVTDEPLSGGMRHVEIARRAVQGGADAIQLRDKYESPLGLVRAATEILKITRQYGALLIINDRLDVALACGADGVHLGQGDIRPGVARQVAPPGFIIGISVGDAEEALLAESEGADYVALSPTFDTNSKDDAGHGHGLAQLRTIRNAVKIPVIAIGGIGPGNVRDVIHAGADGVAVISAVVAAPDITRAARELRSLIVQAKQEMAG
jgi:thiamine-phosphate pyrophosphorylase